MERTKAGYREWIRIRCGIKTPRERWFEAGAHGWDRDPVCPPYGAQPLDQLEPSNYVIDSAITSACNTVVRKCRVQDALHFTDVPVPAQTGNGPATIRFDALPGFPDGGAVRIRRSYWTEDDVTYNRVIPVFLAQQDIDGGNWMNDGPGTPYRMAVEGSLIYLLPGPANDGTLRMTVGSGCLAPVLDDEGYDGIPAAYDDAINYVALTELAAMMPGDSEMQKRLSVFAPFAAEGLLELETFYDNAALEGTDPHANWSTSVSRQSRRN